MEQIREILWNLLPPDRKTTPSGWLSVNAPCCHHRGEKRDTKMRGGVKLDQDTNFAYHCFNCGFKCGYSAGHGLSKNTKVFFKWLGLPDSDIARLALLAMKLKDDTIQKNRPTKIVKFNLDTVELPTRSRPILEWIEDDHGNIDKIVKIVEYLDNRGMDLGWYDWHWSPSAGYADRVLIPFYHDGKVVGYTGRKITDGKPKYLSKSQPGYVFNIDKQTHDKKYVIVTEGQFDAIAIDGVAIMHNEPNETQCTRINNLNKTVIVVPDRDKAGAKLIKCALHNNWSISTPPWEESIKDVADAVKKYGRIYTLYSILHYHTSNKIKIELIKKKLENNEQ